MYLKHLEVADSIIIPCNRLELRSGAVDVNAGRILQRLAGGWRHEATVRVRGSACSMVTLARRGNPGIP